jgi:hypothetical protein
VVVVEEEEEEEDEDEEEDEEEDDEEDEEDEEEEERRAWGNTARSIRAAWRGGGDKTSIAYDTIQYYKLKYSSYRR